jgi:hypothetical protein
MASGDPAIVLSYSGSFLPTPNSTLTVDGVNTTAPGYPCYIKTYSAWHASAPPLQTYGFLGNINGGTTSPVCGPGVMVGLGPVVTGTTPTPVNAQYAN